MAISFTVDVTAPYHSRDRVGLPLLVERASKLSTSDILQMESTYIDIVTLLIDDRSCICDIVRHLDPEITMNYRQSPIDWALIVDKPTSTVQQTTKVQCIDGTSECPSWHREIWRVQLIRLTTAGFTIGHLRAALVEQLGMQ